MNTKKNIVLVGVVLLIIFSALYMKSQSTYGQVKSSQVTENKSEEGSDGRTPEEVALDKKIKEQREKNIKSWREEGRIGSFERGTRGKSLEYEEFMKAYAAAKKYVIEHSDIYEDTDDPNNMVLGPDIDSRFRDFVYEIPPEEKKGIVKGYKDEEIFLQEARRKDGDYDSLILLKNPETGQWSVEYVGNYYDYRDSLK